MMGKNMNTIKKKREALLKIGTEVSTEKTEYVSSPEGRINYNLMTAIFRKFGKIKIFGNNSNV
jgi:hypothetical protein